VESIDLMGAYRTMLTMRLFEEDVGAAVETGEVHGEMHLGIGQEAVAVTLSVLLERGDTVVSTHRPHLHALALGVDPVQLLGELLERDALCRGKGGHMHLFDVDTSFMCTGIVGAGAPQAAGYALAQRRAGAGRVTVAVVGDGAMNQGAVFEALNLAALWRLPMIFLCEDNGYGISVRREAASAGALVERGRPFGIPGQACDGGDPTACFDALAPAFERARRGDGPSVVVADVYRFRGHYEGDADTYRPQAEKDLAMSADRDPVSRLRSRLLDTGVDDAQLATCEAEAAATVAGWFAAARALPLPDVAAVREDVYAS
jgi:TPP-dependent pyruvate/acetoin dehydrogenase alpha subunit